MTEHRAELLFDGSCGLCCRTANAVGRRAGDLDVVDASKLSAGELAQRGVEEAAISRSVVVILPDSSPLEASDAVGALMQRCGAAWPAFGTLLRSAAGQRLGDPIYHFVARHRRRRIDARADEALAVRWGDSLRRPVLLDRDGHRRVEPPR